MISKVKILFIILLSTGAGSILIAQDFTNPQRRDINLQVYSLLENYARYGKLSSNYSTIDENYLKEFTLLFDPSAKVFNDILPYNRMDHEITLDEYLSLAVEYYPSGIGLRLHNIQIDIPSEYSENRYRIGVHILKEIYGTTAQNANYKDTLSLTFNIEYRIEDSGPIDFKIKEIGGLTVGRTLRLLIADKKSGNPLNNIQVRFNNHSYYTNSNGRIEFKDLDPNKSYSYAIGDENHALINQPNFFVDDLIENSIKSNPKAEYFDPNEIVYEFRIPARFYASLHLGPSITPSSIRFSDFEETYPADWTNYSYPWAHDLKFGFKAGYRILAHEKNDVVLLSGIEYARYSSNFYIKHYFREFDDIDMNNESCTKRISIKVAQKISTAGISFPVHFLLKYKRFSNLGINLEAGANINLLLNHRFEGSAKGNFFGTYKQDPVQTIKDDTILGFAQNRLKSYGDLTWSGKNIVATFYLSPTISKNITRSLEIYGGPALVVGMGNLSGNTDPQPLSLNFNDLQPMTKVARKTKLRALSFELGIRYRFADLNGLKYFPF